MTPSPAPPMLLAAALLLAAAPAHAVEWVAVSPDARTEVEQRADGRGGCRLEVRRGERRLWSSRRCLGGRDDGHFLANDGRTLLVVYSFPKNPGATGAATAAQLFVKGKPVRTFEVGRFVKDPKPLVMARKHFYWLEGALGQPGVPPGYSRDGAAVELTTLDRRSWSIRFDGAVRKIALPRTLGR